MSIHDRSRLAASGVDAGLESFCAAGTREFEAVAERTGIVEHEVRIAERRIATRFAGRELADALTAVYGGANSNRRGWKCG